MKYTKITVKINSADKPPYFMGSQLRGAFGYALKRVDKEGVFSKFFEQKDVIHQYRFDIRLGMNFYLFSFYLFDSACDDVYIIVSTFDEMFSTIGLGRNNTKYKDYEIFINDEIVYKNCELKIFENYINKFKEKGYSKELILRFDTPLRIKKQGVFVRNSNIDLEDILNSIYQRSRAIRGKKLKKLNLKPKYQIKSKNIYFKELIRRSNFQKSNMQFGGIMGEIWINNLDNKSYKLLKLGELIGVGKQCVFGLGKISIGDLNE